MMNMLREIQCGVLNGFVILLSVAAHEAKKHKFITNIACNPVELKTFSANAWGVRSFREHV